MNETNKNELIEALQSENEDLKTQLKDLTKDFDELTDKYNTLKESVDDELNKLSAIVTKLQRVHSRT